MSKGKEKKRLYIAAAAAAAVVAVIVLAVVLFHRGGEKTYRSIRIVELQGDVTIDRDKVGSLDASVNMNLVSGDRVTTAEDAYIVLRLDEDKYVMLGEQGAMKVEADGDASNGRTAIRLEAGSVLNEIQNPLGQNSTYEIVTPNATMSVRGTVFEVRCNETDDAGNIEVLVYEGKVAVDLEDQETALYSGGEYTQFTADDTPQFLVERSAIKSEQINGQMLKRLRQIDESGRSLDFGEADLEELIGRTGSDPENLVADNDPVQGNEEPGNLPDFGNQTPIMEVPAPDADASEDPESTNHPSASATPAPAASSKPSAAPAPAASSKPSAAPAPSATPKPPAASAPAATPKPTTAPTQPPASTEKPTPSESPKEKRTVEFYIPVIDEVEGNNIVRLPKRNNDEDSRDPRFKQESGGDNKITEPEKPTYADVQGASSQLAFAGWYTEQNEKWDFQRSVEKDMKLYAVWYIKEGDNFYYYYPVIIDDPKTGYYRCRSVRAGTYLFDQPEDSEIYESNDNKDNGCPKLTGHDKLAWKITNSGSENNNVFWNRNQTVQGVTSLVADWR